MRTPDSIIGHRVLTMADQDLFTAQNRSALSINQPQTFTKCNLMYLISKLDWDQISTNWWCCLAKTCTSTQYFHNKHLLCRFCNSPRCNFATCTPSLMEDYSTESTGKLRIQGFTFLTASFIRCFLIFPLPYKYELTSINFTEIATPGGILTLNVIDLVHMHY